MMRDPARAPGSPWYAASLAAAASGVLGYLSFPDPGADGLVWICFVPLFLAARGAGGRRGFLLGWFTGAIGEGLGFRWILPSLSHFTAFTGYPLSLAVPIFCGWLGYSALSWGILGWLLGRSRTPGAVHAAALVWVGVEHYFPRLFAWHLGGALHDREWLRQGADLFGTSGLSYLILLVNTLAYLLVEWRRRRSPFPRWTAALALLALATASVYGAVRLRAVRAALESAPRLEVGIIQPVVAPEVKHDRGEAGIRFFKSLLARTRTLAAGEVPDLIVWPEGMNFLPFDPEEGHDPLASHRDGETGRMLFDDIASPLVIGGGSMDSRKRTWNTAAYILPPGEAFPGGFRARLYHKNNLMFLGERVPFQERLPERLRRQMKLDDLQAGTSCPLFALRPRSSRPQAAEAQAFAFRVLICYEATIPGYVRRAAEGADFLVNLTEDIWYGRTAHIAQHVSVIRMRAVENRVPLVRSTNVGPSGVVEATGEFAQRTDVFLPAAKGVTLRPGSHFSPYRRGGFLFPLASLLLGVVLQIANARRPAEPALERAEPR